MDELQVNEVLTRNRELQKEQNVDLETLARFAMEFQQWAHDQIKRLRQKLDKTHEDDMDVQQELKHKIGEVKELQQLACSQSQMIEQVGFKINNKVVICCEVQHELDNKNDEIKELKQPDDFIVNRLQGAWEGGFVAGRAEERSVHVLAPPICETSQ